MTDELYEALSKRVDDEIEDVKRYRDLMAQSSGFTALVLSKIIEDEESHARFIREAIRAEGRDVSGETEQAYHEMRFQH